MYSEKKIRFERKKTKPKKGKGKKNLDRLGKKPKKKYLKITIKISLCVQHDLPIKRVLTIKNMDQQFKINLYNFFNYIDRR